MAWRFALTFIIFNYLFSVGREQVLCRGDQEITCESWLSSSIIRGSTDQAKIVRLDGMCLYPLNLLADSPFHVFFHFSIFFYFLRLALNV